MLLSDQHCDIDGEVELNKDEEFTVSDLNTLGSQRNRYKEAAVRALDRII